MGEPALKIRRDVEEFDAASYQAAAEQYVRHARTLPFVRAVYTFGGINDPGISDLDLLVVVDPVYDPEGISRLSIARAPLDERLKYPFVHDIYLYDSASFEHLAWSTYCHGLRLLWGEELPRATLDEEQNQALSLAVIFDFVAARLGQLQSFLTAGRLGLRGVLLRASSLKHSYRLLNNLGLHDEELARFVAKVAELRRAWRAIQPDEAAGLLLEAAYQFSRLVELAAEYFANHYLAFYCQVAPSNLVKVNPVIAARFSDRAAEMYRASVRGRDVYYPHAAFYHYLAYTLCDNLLGDCARRCIARSGGERFDLAPAYLDALRKRLDCISGEILFLRANRARFAMAGQPAFVVDWDAVDDARWARADLAPRRP